MYTVMLELKSTICVGYRDNNNSHNDNNNIINIVGLNFDVVI